MAGLAEISHGFPENYSFLLSKSIVPGPKYQKRKIKNFGNKITSVYPMQDVRVSSIETSEKPLADLKAGSVTVCTGKACVRNGRALVVLDTLSNHFAGTTVSTGECSVCRERPELDRSAQIGRAHV